MQTLWKQTAGKTGRLNKQSILVCNYKVNEKKRFNIRSYFMTLFVKKTWFRWKKIKVPIEAFPNA